MLSSLTIDKRGDDPSQLDASFVHLSPLSATDQKTINDFPHRNLNVGDIYNQGILDSYRYLKTIVQLAEDHIDLSSTGNWTESSDCLCAMCIER